MTKDVLIVDDSALMRSFIQRTLLVSGLEIGHCLEASNGAEALVLLQNRQVDLILTDLNMPVMDGEELLENLHSNSALCALPVIVISTDSTHKRAEQLHLKGVSGYLCKPFTPEQLIGLLRGALPGWGADPMETSP
jgi:two-component system chemotaxis response regulator CheY